jgi:small conductance mechanosensitive channel
MPAQDLIVDLAIRYGFLVLGAIVILFVGLLAAWWVGNAVERPFTRMALEPPLRRLMVRVVRVVVLLFALVIALDKFGFQIAPLVAGIGVAGLGIGIALQGVLSNVIAGLTIIFTKPFRVGEHIEIVGMKGDVHTIELFSTTLVHPDQSRIIIPNPRVLAQPGAVIGVAQIEAAGVRIGVNPWVKVPDAVAAEAEIYRVLVERFALAGIAGPLPRQEVQLVNSGC